MLVIDVFCLICACISAHMKRRNLSMGCIDSTYKTDDFFFIIKFIREFTINTKQRIQSMREKEINRRKKAHEDKKNIILLSRYLVV